MMMTRRLPVLAIFSACAMTIALGAMAPPPQGTRDAPAQTPAPAATGRIAGTVVSADASRAVRVARVSLTGGDQRVTRNVISDEQGAFVFDALGPGEYTLTASKPGYLQVTYGQRSPGSGRPGTPIRLTAGQRMEKIALRIPRGAVITGTILDEAGEPAFGTQVLFLRYVLRSGERTLQVAGSDTTDDRGIYRGAVLQPGEYIVSATPRQDEGAMLVEARMRLEEAAVAARASAAAARGLVADRILEDAKLSVAQAMNASPAAGPGSGYAPIYYPGTTQASAATSLMVAAGEERGGVDLRLQLVPTARVLGGVVGGDAQGVMIQLVDWSQPPGIGLRAARTGPDGRFSFVGVPPGRYTLLARTSSLANKVAMTETAGVVIGEKGVSRGCCAGPGPSSPALMWGQTDLTVDGRDLPNVIVTLQSGMTVSGSVAFEGGTPPPLSQLRLSLTLVPTGQAAVGEFSLNLPGQVDADGRFTIAGVVPGTYRVVPSAGVPPGFLIKSSMFGGRDSLDAPVEVKPGENLAGGVLTFSTRSSEVSGTLQDAVGLPAPDLTVVLFAADERFWTPGSRRIQAVRPATDGRFNFRSLQAGDYRMVAVTDVEPGQWFDPVFLRQLVGGSIALTLAEGERKVQDVRVK